MAAHHSVEQLVRTHGHAVLSIFGNEGPSWAYTVGLWKRGWPEILVFGMSGVAAQNFLNCLVQHLEEKGGPPSPGQVMLDVANLPVGFAEVTAQNQREYMAQAVYHCEGAGGVFAGGLQMVLSDRAGVLPGQPGYDHEYMDKFSTCLASQPWDFSRSMGNA